MVPAASSRSKVLTRGMRRKMEEDRKWSTKGISTVRGYPILKGNLLLSSSPHTHSHLASNSLVPFSCHACFTSLGHYRRIRVFVQGGSEFHPPSQGIQNNDENNESKGIIKRKRNESNTAAGTVALSAQGINRPFFPVATCPIRHGTHGPEIGESQMSESSTVRPGCWLTRLGLSSLLSSRVSIILPTKERKIERTDKLGLEKLEVLF